MMMKLLLGICLGVVLVGMGWWWQKARPYSRVMEDTKTGEIKETVQISKPGDTVETTEQLIMVDNREYEYGWFEVDDGNKLGVYSNLPLSVSSQEFLSNNNCQGLINGGFYGKNKAHLGWVVKEGEEIAKAIRSQLFNGFLMINQTGEVKIESEKIDNVRLGVQSGPLLIRQGREIKLAIRDDEPRRRSVAVVTGERLILMSVHDKGSTMTGPYLADLPLVVGAIMDKLGKKADSALNLDGGSASVFKNKAVYWREANPVGSFLCVK